MFQTKQNGVHFLEQSDLQLEQGLAHLSIVCVHGVKVNGSIFPESLLF